MALSKDLSVQAFATVSGVTQQVTPAYLVDGLTTTPKAATAITNGDVALVTMTAASDAVTLPVNLPKGTVVFIKNVSASNAGVLFPPLGGAFNGGSVNASVALTATKLYIVVMTDNANNALISGAL